MRDGQHDEITKKKKKVEPNVWAKGCGNFSHIEPRRRAVGVTRSQTLGAMCVCKAMELCRSEKHLNDFVHAKRRE